MEEAWQQIAIWTEWKLETVRFCDDVDLPTPTTPVSTPTPKTPVSTPTPPTPKTPVSNTQGNGHAPLKSDPSDFNLQHGAQKEQH